jgi:Zn2+/Cd2+-exporting ATPase
MKKTYDIEGLTCLSCAEDLEEKLNLSEGIKNVRIDFATSRIHLETDDDSMDEIKIEKMIEASGHLVWVAKDKENKKQKKKVSNELLINILGVNLFFISILLERLLVFSVGDIVLISLYLLSYVMIGGKVIYRAVKNMINGNFFDEHFLMTIATLGAIGIGEMIEAVAVMLFYRIGEFLQDLSVNKSRKSILDLMDIKPEIAHIVIDNEAITVHPNTLKINDIIMVKPGEKVPVDGTIILGSSTLDLKSLTGEMLPKDVTDGDSVYSGAINLTKVLTIKVDKIFADSMATKIVDFIQNNQNKKAKTESFITRFSKVYTPIVVTLAVILAFIVPLFISLIAQETYLELFPIYFRRALILLVISCPCALVLSIPLSYFAGIGASSKIGMLVKGGKDLETLETIDHFVFDKTGTLTKGDFEVVDIISEDPNTLLEVVAHIESNSNHPIAKSVVKAYGKTITHDRVTFYEETQGKGVKAHYLGELVLIGNLSFIQNVMNDVEDEIKDGTILYVATKDKFLGKIIIKDTIKKTTFEAICDLQKQNKKITIISGDHQYAVEAVGKDLKIKNFYHSQMPNDKVSLVEKLSKNTSLAFIGDGMNDAPVLLKATLGIAMGGIGSDATIEASDAVIMNDSLMTLVDAIKISKFTKKIVIQNIFFIMGIKGIIILLGIIGYASLWLAIFADVGVALLAVLNSMRILKSRGAK